MGLKNGFDIFKRCSDLKVPRCKLLRYFSGLRDEKLAGAGGAYYLTGDIQSNLYKTVTLGKWPGDGYIQGDHCTQVSFKLF